MQQTSYKQRGPSKCREWERQRRNKFNDAITKLGEVVKEINKVNRSSGDSEPENIQYPKIEIVQKAVIYLTHYVQVNTQLKAEILALEVKLEAIKNPIKNDVSIQVNLVNKKNHNGKYMGKIKLQNSNQKIKDVPEINKVDETKTEKPVIITPSQKKSLPKLLPLSNNAKKRPENTLLMLPATPYIFPQRPLLFPTATPTIVLVDTNLQPLNKPSPIPIINRNSTDITRTTMVNILPISAYSRPLSATKSKKNNSKPKICNKKVKKSKLEEKVDKTIPKQNNVTTKDHLKEESTKDNITKQNIVENEKNETDTTTSKHATEINQEKTISSETISSVVNNQEKTTDKNDEMKHKESTIDLKIDPPSESKEKIAIEKPQPLVIEKSVNIDNTAVNSIKINKNSIDKETLADDKSKHSKLTNILDATICENVDGGNARLELAEELLAASPTAAFLMSFPLVSGNRADSPADDPQNPSHSNPKENNLRRNAVTPQTVPYFDKPNTLNNKIKSPTKSSNSTVTINKPDEQKYINNNIVTSKAAETKTGNLAVITSTSNDNPFLNLPMTSLISTSCSLTDSSFGIEFDCNVTKTTTSQPASYVNTSNIFYKSDPFNTVKNTIYSTSSISSGHDFNSLGLYPCAMEKYTTKSKTDYSNVEDNLMKIGSSRLTYDIDLGWSHKGFDFVNCTTSSNTFNKDNILTSVPNTYSTSYNPFNPDFHVPLVTNTNKKEHIPSKPSTSFPEAISSLYSQTTNLWPDDVPIYNNPNLSKNYSTKHNYHPDIHAQPNVNLKASITKQYEIKHAPDNNIGTNPKPLNITGPHQMPDTKKSPSKMHINWMTSEIRPMQNHCNPSQADIKTTHKLSYSQVNHVTKKQDHSDSNYFPINMHNYPTQSNHEEFQVWPTARPAGTTEISIDPPPINLPTLVGDLALGPHDKKKTEIMGQRVPQADLQNCSSFLSVTQLMNRSTDNMPSRYYGSNIEAPKSIATKQNVTNVGDNRKVMSSRLDTNMQPSYIFNDPKQPITNYENMTQFSQPKSKPNKADKSTKIHKNNYSAEALIRGGTCSQKTLDNSSMKFMGPSQKYNDFNIAQDSSVAQVSHFPPIIDYSDNNYTGQQFSGTTLYNSTTNTISNSFYSNFMPTGTNLMAGNYTSGPFPTDFIDYNQTAECNYTNHKYEELKIKNNSTIFHQDKLPITYKSTRRESTAKHKLECSKKESNKKYQSKRAKLNNEADEWNDTTHLLWQNKTPAKRHANIMSEEIPFPNYVGNQMPSQYQADFFNSHLMPSNMQNMGHHNVDRSLASFPVTSRANFNLSTIFPEITMKVQ